MDVKQIYSLVNDISKEVEGEVPVLNEDLSNIVDVGTTIVNALGYDNYCKALVDRIGRTVFVARQYRGELPSVLMDKWEYGSVLQKVYADNMEASENESWDLQDQASYDVNVFHAVNVTAKYYNSKVTFEVDISIPEVQIKESFTSAEAMNTFIEMIYTVVENTMTEKISGLNKRGVNTLIAETFYNEFQTTSGFTSTGTKAVNLLYLYNQRFGTSLTAATALTDKDFNRFAAYQMGVIASRMQTMTKLYNIEGKSRFTPADELTVVLHSDFYAAAKAYLYSDTYHNEFVRLPNADVISCFQGAGTSFDFDDTSKIMTTTPSGHTMTITGVLGVLFDRRAVATCNADRRVRSNFVPSAEFYNNYFKYDCMLCVGLDEQAVVFYVA